MCPQFNSMKQTLGIYKQRRDKLGSTTVPTLGTQQNRGVMVTLKKCKFLQLCGHQIGVQLTLPSCIFTPKWCKYDLHTILNAFKNTFAVLQQH